MDLWNLQIPLPMALAVVALIGYLFGRRTRSQANEMAMRSRRELRRAQQVAAELEKIAWSVRQSLTRHHASVNRFKQRVSKLSDEKAEAAFQDLCREAEEILKPTMRLATQIANAYDEIRQQSASLMTFTEVRTDSLTGVHNRRGLDDALAAQFALLNRYGSKFAVAMFDIDHFKRINDLEGHLSGDRVLQDLAKLLDDSVRETDIVARYGGEEFLIVMPQTDLPGASIFAERLRAMVAEKMRITISGGVAATLDGDTADTLLSRSDAALYDAKSAGRNRVHRHDGEHCEPVVEAPVAETPVAAAG